MAWWDRKPTFPRNQAALRVWLKDTEDGRAIVREAAKESLENACRGCERLRPYPRVLVVVRWAGLWSFDLTVFREEGVTVRVQETVDAPDCGIMDELAEDILWMQLPRSWQPLSECDARTQENYLFRGFTAERWYKGILELRLLRELQAERENQ